MLAAETSLLRLVAQAHSIIAQLYKISKSIPQELNADIFLDFIYFKKPFKYDQERDLSDAKIKEDEKLRNLYFDVAKECVITFRAIFRYGEQLYGFLTDLDKGLYVRQSLDSMLNDEEGKQLLIESLFLYGVMILIIDMKIDGSLREKVIVAYVRWKSSKDMEVSDQIKTLFCKLNQFESSNFPESLFARFKVYPGFVERCLGRLRTDDVFNQMIHYPLPEQRSVALSNQATMIFICLFFKPEILKEEFGVMREIVDRHFPDNWIISIYLGRPVDISMIWNRYPAAKTAISITLESERLKKQVKNVVTQFKESIEEIKEMLKEGVLNEEFVLHESSKVLNVIRKADCLLRFLLLHTTSFKLTKSNDVTLLYELKNNGKIVSFLFDIAQLELKVKEIVKKILLTKQEKCKGLQQEVSERFIELGDYFGGKKVLTKVEKSEYLETWFIDLSEQVKLLQFDDVIKSGRILVQIIKALEEVQNYRQFDVYIHMKKYLIETSKMLFTMVKLLNISDSYLVTLNQVSEFTYAWEIMPECVSAMHKLIKNNPKAIQNLRATFIKMASSLDTPLFRLGEAKSKDLLVKVSKYYSRELVAYVEKLLQIVPATMFTVIDEIALVLTNELHEMPTRMEKSSIHDFMQFDARFKLSELTFKVSCYTEGLLIMEKTLVGVMEINPRLILNHGLRQELRQRILDIYKSVFVKLTASVTLTEKLNDASRKINGLRKSLAYLNDFVHLDFLTMWKEEFNTGFQSSSKISDFLHSFIDDLVKLTDPRKSFYLASNFCWIDMKLFLASSELKVIFDIQMIEKAYSCFGVPGFHTLIELLENKIKGRLENIFSNGIFGLVKNNTDLKEFLLKINNSLGPNITISNDFNSIYLTIKTQFPVWFKQGNGDLDWYDELASVGQLLKLLHIFKLKVYLASNSEAPLLSSSISTLHDSLMDQVYCKSKKIGSAVMWPGSLNSQDGFNLLNKVKKLGFTTDVLQKYIEKLPDDQGDVLPTRMYLFLFCVLFAEISKAEYIPKIDTFVNGSSQSGLTSLFTSSMSNSNLSRDSGLVFEGWYCLCIQLEECAVSSGGRGEKVLESTMGLLGQFERSCYNSLKVKNTITNEMAGFKLDVCENIRKVLFKLDRSLELLAETRIP